MRIYLCRHAQEAKGSRDPERAITNLGKQQSRALARFLSDKNIQALYSSDLPRALQTAQIVGEKLGLTAKVLPSLQEISTSSPEDWGDFVKTHHMDLNFLVGGRESINMVMKRGKKALEKIIREEEGKNVAIVAHGVFTKALLYALGYKEHLVRNDHVANTGVTVLEYGDGNISLVKFNHYSHLLLLRVKKIIESPFSKIFHRDSS